MKLEICCDPTNKVARYSFTLDFDELEEVGVNAWTLYSGPVLAEKFLKELSEIAEKLETTIEVGISEIVCVCGSDMTLRKNVPLSCDCGLTYLYY